MPVDRIAEMYASRVWTGELHPDSVAPRARWVRWDAPDGTWERRQVQIPGPDFLEDVGTLTWSVIVTETKPASGAADGTIAIGGELVYTGYEGRCHGLLEAG